jgi:hypothetical protein
MIDEAVDEKSAMAPMQGSDQGDRIAGFTDKWVY